jgi:DNA processing protein
LTVSTKEVQLRLFPKISENQQKLYNLIPPGEQKNIGKITEESNLNISEVLSDLMQMELLGLVKALPGGFYQKK